MYDEALDALAERLHRELPADKRIEFAEGGELPPIRTFNAERELLRKLGTGRVRAALRVRLELKA